MINLGFSTAGLFFIAGFLYSRRYSTNVSAFGGLAKKVPLLATFFLIIGLASIGLPGTNGFVGEFLILLGAFKAHWEYAVIAVTGVIFGAAYLLWYYERAMFGPLAEGVQALTDLNGREFVIALSLSIMIFWIGIYPAPFLDMMNGSVEALVQRLARGALVADHELGDGMIRPRSVLAHRDNFTRPPQTPRDVSHSDQKVLAEERRVLATQGWEGGITRAVRSNLTTP